MNKEYQKTNDLFRNGSNGRDQLKMFDRFLNQLTGKVAPVYRMIRLPPTRSDYTKLEPVEQEFINSIYLLSKANVSMVRN